MSIRCTLTHNARVTPTAKKCMQWQTMLIIIVRPYAVYEKVQSINLAGRISWLVSTYVHACAMRWKSSMKNRMANGREKNCLLSYLWHWVCRIMTFLVHYLFGIHKCQHHAAADTLSEASMSLSSVCVGPMEMERKNAEWWTSRRNNNNQWSVCLWVKRIMKCITNG